MSALLNLLAEPVATRTRTVCELCLSGPEPCGFIPQSPFHTELFRKTLLSLALSIVLRLFTTDRVPGSVCRAQFSPKGPSLSRFKQLTAIGAQIKASLDGSRAVWYVKNSLTAEFCGGCGLAYRSRPIAKVARMFFFFLQFGLGCLDRKGPPKVLGTCCCCCIADFKRRVNVLILLFD